MKKKILLLSVIVIVLMLSVAVTAYAESEYPMTYLPGTTDIVTNLPTADTGTGGEVYTVSSTIPEREGYEFIDKWEALRLEDSTGSAKETEKVS